ncbi:MAG: hypothetical protein DI603_03465 [Roseateles depolymerans]|uniref:7TM-DISM receptor extracellular domain-containing protein n=1 Tax=Roseateles depolymerans TaxID=76731 RepID=A0A2W5E318_9BURK|nr:MAG: hypothetical protein DI603_03465 [Roseateles depolymerans]
MCKPVGSVILIAVLRWVLLMGLAGGALQAAAQRLPQPNAPLSTDLPAPTELATSRWTRAQLDSWWAMLRRQSVSGAEGLRIPAELQPPDDAGAWRPVQLPDVRSRPGTAEVTDAAGYEMRWYRVHVPAHDAEPMALYIPRLSTLTAAVLGHSDDGWRLLLDNQPVAREQWVQPIWLPLPAAGRGMDIVVALPVQADGYHIVSRIWVGPRATLEKRWQWRGRLQAGLPQAISLTLVVLGLFALTLWLRRPAETIYALFAFGAVAWLIRNMHYYTSPPQNPALLDWFWWATHASAAWVMLFVLLLALRFADRRQLWLERVLVGSVALVSVLSMPLWLQQLDTVVLQYSITALLAAGGTVWVGWLAWRERRAESCA